MKKSLLVLTLLFISFCSWSQDDRDLEEEQKGFQKNRLFVGGNFGLTFGNYSFINISPQIGYRFNRYLAAGTGLNFQYVSLKEKYSNGDLYRKTSRIVTGLNIFGRVYPINQFMLQVQPEANYVFGKEKYYDTNPQQTYNLDAKIVPSLLVGGGLVLPSGRGSFIASVFYDVLQDVSSPYSDRPIFNFTYNFGL